MTEYGVGVDGMGVRVTPWQMEAGHESGSLLVARWDEDQTDWASRRFGGRGVGVPGFVPPNDAMFHELGIKPYSVTMSLPHEHNLITTGGWDRCLNLLAGAQTTGSYIGTGTRIGVGTATNAAASGQTDLSATTGPTARFFNLVTGNGTISAGTAVRRLQFTATFATGDANFHWQEWCHTDDVEIMTADGWRRYDEIAAGDVVLGMDPATRTSRWEPLQGVAVWPHKRRMMRRLESTSHSSMSTLDHRWFVRQRVGRDRRVEWAWTTTRELTNHSAIPRAVPCADLPTVPKYDDALVELVGWFWTEGWTVHRGGSVRAEVGQSELRHPAQAASIRAALAAQFPGEWSEQTRPDGMVTFTLRVAPTADLLAVTGEGKAPTSDFIRSLTRAQLLLLVETAMAGDGTTSRAGQRTWLQVNDNGVRMFEMVCALAGIPTNTGPGADSPSRFGESPQRVALLKRDIVRPVQAAQLSDAAVDEIVEYEGIVWCPQTPSTTWLARRRGTVFWTGNCIDQATTGSGTGAASGIMLNRAVSDQGTKVSGQTWTATANLDYS